MDNVIIALEVFHSMRYLKRKKGWVAVKIDLEKAYDCVSWSFLRDTLRDVGISVAFCNLIVNCVSLSSFQVLFNGEKMERFRPT